MSIKSFNVRPYFDDFNEEKNFYQILFRPTYAIQARELNQMQTILQEQVARTGRHLFKEGSMVIPGAITLDVNMNYVQLDSTYNSASVDGYLSQFVGSEIEVVGQTSGARAKVVMVKGSTAANPPTLYVKYTSSGSDLVSTGTLKTFQAGEIIATEGQATNLYASVKNTLGSMGLASSVNIQRGVYFVNSRFALVEEQSILLDDYSNTPTYKVGLAVGESFVTPEEDSTLYDNAQGSPNFAAPGAHRYALTLTLKKYLQDDSDDKSFVELLRVTNGIVESQVVKTEYSLLEDSLARRTYDESGNYAVSGFTMQTKEHRSNDRGTWVALTQYKQGDVVLWNGNYYSVDRAGISGLTPPTHTIGAADNGSAYLNLTKDPKFNQGAFSADNGGDETSMALLVEPGTAYVQGYEIEKIGTSVVKIPKASTYKQVRNATVQTHLGSYAQVDNVFGYLDVTSFPTVTLRSAYTSVNGTAAGSIVGTAKARYMEYDTGTIGTAACQYVLSLFDIQMNDGLSFEANARQVYFQNSSGQNFTANFRKFTTPLSGSISTASGSPSLNGVGTKFTSELNVGDCVGYYSGATLVATFFILSIASDTLATMTTNAGAPLSGVNGYHVASKIFEAGNENLVFPMPSKKVRKVRDIDDEGITNISYHVRADFSGIVSATTLIISTASSAETFASPDQPDAFHVVDTQTGNVASPTVALNSTSNVATLTFPAGFDTHTIRVLATVKRTLKERTKTLVRGFAEDFTVQATVQQTKLALSKVDGCRLLKVAGFTDSGGVPVPFGSPIPSNAIEVDITNRFLFSGGQRDGYYEFSSIQNTTGAMPRSPIRVTYDYREHSSVGDYFTADSYQKIEPASWINASGETVDLFDAIDFRPTKTSTGFSRSGVPSIGFDINADYTYFLPRVDKLSISDSGEFVLSSGTPADQPTSPNSPNNSMLLYTVTVNPTVTGTPALQALKEDNRRYTMRDIGALERRIANVEYYTSLSALESQAKNLQLFNEDGTLSFKNGFIVDSLIDQRVVDTNSTEFRASIDVSNGILRPAFGINNVQLIEQASTDSERLASGYSLRSGIATLPYSTTPMAVQKYASTTESVTPYVVLTFIGDVKMNPASDDWYESKYKPDIVISQEGNFQAVANQFSSSLGTVWNAWQTTWVGTSVTDGGSFLVTQELEGQVRSGVQTYVKAVYDTQVISDREVSFDFIPFIRARVVSFFGYGLKPNTKVYPFFDSTDVSSYVTGASRINLTTKNGAFDYQTHAGSAADQAARTIGNGTVATGLSTGDVVHNGLNGNIALATATAVVLIDEDSSLKVANVIGTFSPGQTIYGTLSGASGTVNSVENNLGLLTNYYGEVAGTFSIPSDNKLRFRTGTRNFTLSDSRTNSSDYTTKATGIYEATGILQTRQRTVLSTRNGELAKAAVTQNQTVVTNEWINWKDPLAQSFKVPVGSGMFIENIDVYFAAKDRTLPVTLDIREMVNGLPTEKTLPGSKINVKPNSVAISTDSSAPTNIRLPHPIFVDSDTEYCFVLSSDSPNYRVWVSEVGKDDIITGQRIAQQPYLGSMFKSQNSSTWTPDQLKDIKFSINRCVFNTNVAGNIKFNNVKVDPITLERNAIYTKLGSDKIRVKIPNHGLVTNSKFEMSGFTTTVNGIPSNALNGLFTVLFHDIDSVVVQVASPATTTGYSNFFEIVSTTPNIGIDLANLSATTLTFKEAEAKHFFRCTDANYSMTSEAVELIPNENAVLSQRLVIANTPNQTNFNGGSKSALVTAQLQSTNPAISPVLDVQRYSLITVTNRIDENSSSKAIAGLDDLISTNIPVTITPGKIADAAGRFSGYNVGQKILTSGATNPQNNSSFTITAVSTDGSYINVSPATTVNETVASFSVTSYQFFFSEISTLGTSFAKYIMKPLVLSNPATDLKIFFDASLPNPSSISLYYRTSNGSRLPSTWTLANPATPITFNDDRNKYSGAEYSLKNLPSFSNAQIKIVFNSTDSTKIPLVKQIRMIATT